MNPLPFRKTEVIRFIVVVVVALSLPLAAGVYADTWQDSSPVWTVVGVIVGCVLSVFLVFSRIGKRLDAYTQDSDNDVDSVEKSATNPNEEEPAQCQNC